MGFTIPGPSAAGWELARYWALALREGGEHVYDRAAALWGLWRTLGTPPEIAALVQVMDAWEETLQGQRAEVELEMSGLAQPIIDAAERALAMMPPAEWPSSDPEDAA